MNNKAVFWDPTSRTLRGAARDLMTIALLSFAGQHAFAAAPARARHQLDLLKAPLSFEVNQGQTEPTVKFLSHGDGYTLFLTPKEAVFRLKNNSGGPSVVRMELLGASPAAQVSGTEKLPRVANYYIGNDPAKWRTGISNFGKVKYHEIYPGVDAVFYGNQRQLEYDFIVAPGAAPSQISLGLSGVQPSLDAHGNVVLKLADGNLTLKKPIVYQGAGDQKKIIDACYLIAGNTVRFRLGKFDHNQTLVIDPVLDYLTYLGGTGYDIIGKNVLGSSNPATQGIAVDPSGNVIVAGLTSSTDFPLQNAFQAQNGTAAPPNQTAFVAEFNPTGTGLIYSTYLGGSYTDQAYAVAVDSSGSAYVTGSAQSPDFPTTPGAYQTRCGAQPGNNHTVVTNCGSGLSNVFLSKLDSSGGLVYSTFLGGSTGDYGNSVAVDSLGQAYVAGFSQDSCNTKPGFGIIEQCFPESANALLPQPLWDSGVNPSYNPGAAFVAVFDATGANLLYSTLYGDQNPSNSSTASNATYGVGVAVDTSFNFYLTGYTNNPEVPTTAGSFQPTYNFYRAGYANNYRVFVAQFSPVTGIAAGANFTYGSYLGGTGGLGPISDDGNEFAAGIAADSEGNAYVTGLTSSYDFPVSMGTTCAPTDFCLSVAFLTKINPSGTGLVWSTLVGKPASTGNGTVNNIGAPRLDSANNVYITGEAGQTQNIYYPLVNPVQPPPQNQQTGIFATEYDPTGSTILFSTLMYSPAGNGVYPSGIDVDSQGNIYVAGNTFAQDLPTTPGVFQPALNASPSSACPSLGNICWDALIARIGLE